MRIREYRRSKPPKEPFKFGEGSHGKRKLVRVVMDLGYSLRLATKMVDAIFAVWKKALAKGDRKIEMPIGHLKVKRTPKRLRNKRYAARKIGKKELGRLVTWTTYNDEYRILWRGEGWKQLVAELNPGWQPKRTKGSVSAPLVRPWNGPGIAYVSPRLRTGSLTVPSRTGAFRK